MDFSEYYHIYNHSNGNENLFLNVGNYSFFLKKYAEHIHPICQTYAYCLMPNHFHLLVKIRDKEEIQDSLNLDSKEDISPKMISKRFSNFFSSYTQAFNKMHNRRGSLFMKNFKRKLVLTDFYFINLIQYIHYNPVHHGFTKSVDEWEWSSYLSFLSNKKTLLEREIVLEWMNGIDGYLRLHCQEVDKSLFAELES
ncbi:MAG: transposase [Chitinophagales bacterium]|nr:transposase [Chitinophagales bacterium]